MRSQLPSLAPAVLSFRPAFSCFVPARRPGECMQPRRDPACPDGRQYGRLQNTGDLQGECDANYNATPCTAERKAAGARTGGNNAKNRAKNNGNRQKSGRVPTYGCDAGRQATALHASRCRRTKFVVDEPGRNSHTLISAISTNSEHAQARNDTTKSTQRNHVVAATRRSAGARAVIRKRGPLDDCETTRALIAVPATWPSANFAASTRAR